MALTCIAFLALFVFISSFCFLFLFLFLRIFLTLFCSYLIEKGFPLVIYSGSFIYLS